MTGDDNHDSDQPETSNPSQPIPSPTSQIPYTVLSIKLHILKKREYDIWAMKMEHYLYKWHDKVLSPKTAEEVVARERERKARTTFLMALPKDHLAKLHKMDDVKEMWEAIKSRFGLHKGYDRFQTLLSQLEIHGAGVSYEDANQKFLRSLPSFWSQVALIMRTKPELDTLSFDDLYNNLRVFERDVKGSASYTDEVIHYFFANQSSAPQLDCDDLEQINDDNLEEMDLKWHVAIIFMRIKKFHKRTGRKLQFDTRDTVGFDKTKSGHVEEDTQNFAMMAYSSSNSGPDNETSADESDSKPVKYASSDSDSSVEPSTYVPEPVVNESKVDDPHKALKDKGIIDNGCSMHMI
nr:ribonuclease H-like domain-containing protein [Tanacetum cinerariifolium]